MVSHQAFEVFPSDEDMFFWKVLLTGPELTPYSGGCWMLSIFFPARYPSVAPEIRFVTPIRHCNINAHGRVRECTGADALKRFDLQSVYSCHCVGRKMGMCQLFSRK